MNLWDCRNDLRTPSKTVPVKTRITPHTSPRPNFGPEQDKVHNLYLSHLHSLRRQLVAESLTCGQRCVAVRHSIERVRPMTRILSVPLQFAFGAKTLRASRRIQALATLFEGSHRRGAQCTSGAEKEEPQKIPKASHEMRDAASQLRCLGCALRAFAPPCSEPWPCKAVCRDSWN